MAPIRRAAPPPELAHGYPEEFVQEIQGLIDSSKRGPPLTAWLNIKQKLMHAPCNSIYILEHVDVKLFLVSRRNRGGIGVNAFNAHRHGLDIKTSGADVSKLQHSTAFELGGHEAREEVEFNIELVRSAEGMLAEANHAERFITNSSKHTSQFLKAAN